MNIAIITGGTGPEKFVSVRSAENIRKNIDCAQAEVFMYPSEWGVFLNRTHEFNCVIPVIHGKDGEDGFLQKKLDELSIPYIFSRPEIHALGFDKELAKQKLQKIHIPQAISYNNLSKSISFPIIAKPKAGGSSIGVFLVKNKEEFKKIHNKQNYLFEQFIQGREFTVGVIEYDNEIIPLPIMEAKINKVFSYEDKYSEKAKEIEIFPVDISKELEKKLKKMALDIHNYLEIDDLSRIDFMLDDKNNIYFLEINTIPGMTDTSWIPKMLKKAEINFPNVLEYWLKKVCK